MGKQIQIRLSATAEQRLTDFLQERFPECQIVDATYPADWDKASLSRSSGAKVWIILDRNDTPLLLQSAHELTGGHGSPGWRIRSRAGSCIEWNRDMYRSRDRPLRGRLYVSTTPHPAARDLTAESVQRIHKMYLAACRWIRKHAAKDTTHSYAVWTIEDD